MFVVLQQQGTEELPDTAADTPRQLSMIALGRGLFKLNTQRPTVHDLLVVWFGLNASAAQLLNEADLQAELALFLVAVTFRSVVSAGQENHTSTEPDKGAHL
jgi:hypothetical protein